MSPPYKLPDYLQQLQSLGLPHEYDETLAQQLRLQASVKSGGIIFISGTDCMVYAPWIADGMSMATRLLVHIESSDELPFAYQDLKLLFDQDIRIAAHIQNTDSFMQDLSQYQFDLMLLSGPAALERSPTLVERIPDRGVAVLLHAQAKDFEKIGSRFFVASAGADHGALFMSHVSEHKKAGRRGGRSGRSGLKRER